MVELLTITDKINIILIPILVFVGFILNTLTIMVFCRKKMKKYCLSISMIFLAIFDMLILLGPVLFTWIDDNFFQSYFVNNTIWCNLHGYTDLIFSANSSWIIILISVERWFAVWRPWQKAKQFTNKRMKIIILILFIFSTIVSAYFPLSIRNVNIEETVKSENKLKAKPTHNYECRIYRDDVYSLMGTASVLLIYVIPFFLLAILNIMIIIKLRQRPLRAQLRNQKMITESLIKKNNSDSCQPKASSTIGTLVSNLADSSNANNLVNSETSCENHKINNSKNDQNLSITLVTVAVTFMILTFPFQAFWFYENFIASHVQPVDTSSAYLSVLNNTSSINNSTTNSSIDAYEKNLRNLTFIIKNMNYLINFFLYSALSKLFRSEFLALVKNE